MSARERDSGVARAVGQLVREMAALAEAGLPVPFERWASARESGSHPTEGLWAVVACTLQVAQETGAPLATVLRDLANLCDRLEAHCDQVEQSMAGPRMARRIIMLLPILAVPLASVLGFDAVAVLVGTVPGWILAALAGVLTWVGRRWSSAMIARASAVDLTPGLYPRTVAIGVSAGLGISAARARALGALTSTELFRRLRRTEVEQTELFLSRGAGAGVPVVAGLRALDAQFVDTELHTSSVRARELGERLLLPLGVCTLPAFICLGVVPSLISVVSSTHLGI